MYSTAKEIIKISTESKKTVFELTLEHETENSTLTEQELLNELKNRWIIMKDSATKGIEKPIYSLSSLTGGNAHKLNNYLETDSYSGKISLSAMMYAFSTAEVNASMGKIVAAPTAGAAGILPAALLTAKQKYMLSDDQIIEPLLVAGAIGNIIATNATVSGAEGGCQVECGSAAAMAAGALASIQTNDANTIFTAASFALISVMGLICDPVGGLVEFPCALRNASGVINAISSADIALAGVQSLVTFDEVVSAMYKVGCLLPMQLKETALGGIAIEESAIKACKRCHI